MLVTTGILIVLAGIAAIILAAKWPFSRHAVIAHLSKDMGSRVSIGQFHTTYLPPGFEARQVAVADPASGSPVLTAQEFKVRASYPGLLFGRLSRVEVDGFRITSGASHLAPQSEKTDADNFVARNGLIDVGPPIDGSEPFQVSVQELILRGAGRSRPAFELTASSNKMPGKFRASGNLDGGFDRNSRISARYTFSGADLSVFGGIQGTLASSGRITGSPGRLEWTGSAQAPNFHVSGSAHRVDLKSSFQFAIDTSTANFNLERIQASFNRTTILAHGSLSSDQSQPGKTLRLTANVDQGRVDDLLTLVASDIHPSMTGAIRFNANVILPPDGAPFLRRLKVDGTFQIDRALFTNPKTQSPLNYLSESSHDASRAEERRDPEQIPATIRGNVHDARGVARVDQIRYAMPGVDASLGGTFNLVSKAIRFNGVLTTTGELPDATSLFKAVILSAAKPFFGIHKKNKTTIAGFTITGTTAHPSLSLANSKLARDAARLARR